MIFASLVFAAALSAMPAPVTGLRYLVGPWNCTYRAGTMRLAYHNIYAYDLNDHVLRQTASWTGGGDEELLAYDAQHGGWSAVVFDDHGNATVMRAAGSDPNHIAFHSVYPNASVGVTFDRISMTQYTLHGTVRTENDHFH